MKKYIALMLTLILTCTFASSALAVTVKGPENGYPGDRNQKL